MTNRCHHLHNITQHKIKWRAWSAASFSHVWLSSGASTNSKAMTGWPSVSKIPDCSLFEPGHRSDMWPMIQKSGTGLGEITVMVGRVKKKPTLIVGLSRHKGQTRSMWTHHANLHTPLLSAMQHNVDRSSYIVSETKLYNQESSSMTMVVTVHWAGMKKKHVTGFNVVANWCVSVVWFKSSLWTISNS